MKTYNIHFNDSENSNDKDFRFSLQECRDYIATNNGTKNSYFADYKNGTVSIICNETGEIEYETTVL